jgi:hypothetical protein
MTPCHAREGRHPVTIDVLVCDYWVARSSRAMTMRDFECKTKEPRLDARLDLSDSFESGDFA